jgi:hypothetical protein
MSLENLVVVFGPNVFRCPSAPTTSNKGNSEKYLAETIDISKTLLFLLKNYDQIFSGFLECDLQKVAFPTQKENYKIGSNTLLFLF